jgi:hypothetical protein
LWILRIVWLTLPLTAGPAASAAVRDWSTATRVTVEILLWIAWGVGLLAALVLRPPGVTALRTLAPAFLVLSVVVALDGAPSSAASIAAIVATVVASVLSSGHDVAVAAANAVAYGDEQRLPLRAPPALFLAPVPLARAVVVVGLAGGPLLLASERYVVGAIAVAVGWPLAAIAALALHRLSVRWAVLVPAGFVVVDPMTLADPVLFSRARVAALYEADIGSAPPDVLDLRLGAAIGSVDVRFDQPAELYRASRPRKPTETVQTPAIRIAVVRHRELLRFAASRRLPVRRPMG